MEDSLGGHEEGADTGVKQYATVEEAVRSKKFRTRDFFALHSAKRGICKQQMRVFGEAVDSGYYDVPKKIDTYELSERFGTSPSTIAEHLRKTKSKIICIFWNFLEKL